MVCRDVEDVDTVVVRYALAATDDEDLASYEISARDTAVASLLGPASRTGPRNGRMKNKKTKTKTCEGKGA